MLTIYHNSRCSKSRQTLALIQEAGVEPQIIKYLEDPLTKEHIQTILSLLGLQNPKDLMRKGEAIYKELKLKDETNSDRLLEAMVSHPKLIERPIVLSDKRAILGRPPENVNALLP